MERSTCHVSAFLSIVHIAVARSQLLGPVTFYFCKKRTFSLKHCFLSHSFWVQQFLSSRDPVIRWTAGSGTEHGSRPFPTMKQLSAGGVVWRVARERDAVRESRWAVKVHGWANETQHSSLELECMIWCFSFLELKKKPCRKKNSHQQSFTQITVLFRRTSSRMMIASGPHLGTVVAGGNTSRPISVVVLQQKFKTVGARNPPKKTKKYENFKCVPPFQSELSL